MASYGTAPPSVPSRGDGEFAANGAPSGRPRIWAIGGGKGGVGKSLVATNLAVRMAQLGHRVTLVDGDLGGANLDTLLGCPRPSQTIADLFERRAGSLADITVTTSVANLALVAGGDALGAANPAHAQKQKLIRQLRSLTTELVVVDLGAGTSFNTIDLFLAADVGLCVTTPEPTSLQNCFAFIKAACLREVEVRTKVPRRDLDDAALRRIATEGPQARAAMGRATSLVVNRAQPAEARRVANLLHDLTVRFLGGQVRLRGTIHDDAAMARSVRNQRPLCEADPTSRAATDIDTLARSLWTPEASLATPGINEEILHDGARLHVQTEDLGTTQGAVRTQVFLGDGSVVFTRRTPYVDAFFEKLSAMPHERARYHHVAIVRAVRSGRLGSLRRSA